MPTTTTQKRCSICQERKPLEAFPAHRGARDGKQARCRPCSVAYLAAWNLANPEKRAGYARRQHLKKYGLTEKTYRDLLKAQGGRCAICIKKPGKVGRKSALHVDHDHKTGMVRGLLCHNCNVAIGLLKEDAGLLLRATQYLTNH